MKGEYDHLFPYYRDLLTTLSAGLTANEIVLNGISKTTDVAGGVVVICQITLLNPNGTFIIHPHVLGKIIFFQGVVLLEHIRNMVLKVSEPLPKANHPFQKDMYMKQSMELLTKSFRFCLFFRIMDMEYQFLKKIRQLIVKLLITFRALKI